MEASLDLKRKIIKASAQHNRTKSGCIPFVVAVKIKSGYLV